MEAEAGSQQEPIPFTPTEAVAGIPFCPTGAIEGSQSMCGSEWLKICVANAK